MNGVGPSVDATRLTAGIDSIRVTQADGRKFIRLRKREGTTEIVPERKKGSEVSMVMLWVYRMVQAVIRIVCENRPKVSKGDTRIHMDEQAIGGHE